jgi:peptide-methionine (R)-S-oxide reductase
MERRKFMTLLLGGAGALMLAKLMKFKPMERAMADDSITPINKPDAEWKAELPPESYDVLRHEGTERPFTSKLLEEHRKGDFVCMGCGLPLFHSDAKFDSGTGWPSFFDAIPGHIAEKSDYKIIMERTEYHCARCGGHQGHVFNDGPQPTGLRYCNNGVALKFVPKSA